MTITQQMGIHWVVKDPDGGVVIDRTEWELIPYTVPGDEHGFVGPTFVLNKAGTWTVKTELLMNRPSPVAVDSYEGDLCTVTTEVPPTYELIQETIYPFSYVYDGDDETAIFTFKTAPFVPADWAAEKLAAAIESEVEKEGGRVLELKVYADKTPLLWTDFRIEVTSTPLGGAIGAAGIAVGIPIWAAILIAALAIALLIAVITWSIKTIVGTFTHKALSPEIKATWSRGTLISTIGDFETKLERIPTPPEELEAMSDGELRDYCDQLAEEIVPPEISWLPLAIVGVLGVLGAGAAIALAARPRE